MEPTARVAVERRGSSRWRWADQDWRLEEQEVLTVGRWPAIVALVACVACDRAATRLSTERAPWSYVEDAWGGLGIAESRTANNQVSMTFRLRVHEPKRLDSAICTCGTTARVMADRILVRLDKCLCSGGASTRLIAVLPQPISGEYDVVYDDAAAGFPHVARLRVP